MTVFVSSGDYIKTQKHNSREAFLPCGKVVTSNYAKPNKGLLTLHKKVCEICKNAVKQPNETLIDSGVSNKAKKKEARYGTSQQGIYIQGPELKFE